MGKRRTKRVGPVFEDKSYRVKGGKVFDPDSGKVRKRIRVPKRKR